METIGFIGLGIMGAPMAGHLLDAGYTVVASDHRSAPPKSLVDKGLKTVTGHDAVARAADIVITMVPDTPQVADVLFGEKRRRRRAVGGQAGHRHELDLADRDEEIRRADQRARLRLSRRAGVGRRGRRQGGDADDHGRRLRGGVRARQAGVREDGQEHHAGRRQRRRPDDEGRQPDRRGADHRGGRRGAGVCRRRPAPIRPRCGRR